MIFDPYPPPVGKHRHSSKMPPPPQKKTFAFGNWQFGIWQFPPPPPPLTKYPLDTIFTDQTKAVLSVGVVKYNHKFTIGYSNNMINYKLKFVPDNFKNC